MGAVIKASASPRFLPMFGAKLLVLEAFVRSSMAWVMVRMVPYRWWKSRLGVPVSVDVRLPLSPENLAAARAVSRAHAFLSRRASGVFTCLMLALSARAMLSARGVPHVLVLGVKLDKSGAAQTLAAHAWIVCGNSMFVVGGDQKGSYSPVAAYAYRTLDR